mmetsp:Transcript_28676/g.95196  ORF Transcript_28676/g.95196 Transcript_28676/m.95196 type:complete len:217 (-) Transcript_28676:587-1237(-)
MASGKSKTPRHAFEKTPVMASGKSKEPKLAKQPHAPPSSREALHWAHVHKEATGAISRHAHRSIHVHCAHPAHRGSTFERPAVPWQQLPDGVDRIPKVHEQLVHERDARNSRQSCHLGPIQLHVERSLLIQRQIACFCDHSAAQRRQQLAPAHKGDHGKTEDRRVERRLQNRSIEVNALCYTSDSGDPPRHHLQLMEFEKELGFLGGIGEAKPFTE